MSFFFAVNQAVLAHVFKVKAGDIGHLFLSPLFFIILIIALAIIGYTGYNLVKTWGERPTLLPRPALPTVTISSNSAQIQDTEPVTEPEVETGWQTFSSTAHNLKFSYPPAWTKSTSSHRESTFIALDSPYDATFSLALFPEETGFECYKEVDQESVWVDTESTTKTIYVYDNDPSNEICYDPRETSDREITWVPFEHNDYRYLITFTYPESDRDEQQSTLNDILDTFSFTD